MLRLGPKILELEPVRSVVEAILLEETWEHYCGDAAIKVR